MTRYFWLSFSEPSRPEGERFLGVCIVAVDDTEATTEKVKIDIKFPNHQPGAEWIAAASRKAWAMGCNPGGQIGVNEITAADVEARTVPLHHLMSRPELEALGLV